MKKTLYKVNYNYEVNFTVICKITDYCNYSCRYCCEMTTELHRLLINLDKLYDFIVYLLRIYTKKTITISLYGGEPTLHPLLLEFCKKIYMLHSKNLVVEIFSNGSASYELYSALLAYNVELIITYHCTADFNSFVKKINNLLCIKSDNILINVMYDNIDIERPLTLFRYMYNYIYNDLKSTRKSQIFIKRILPSETYHINYSSLDMLQLQNLILHLNSMHYTAINFNGHTVYDKDMELIDNSFKYWLCSAGMTSIYIDTDNNIYSCYSCLNKKNPIGNIITTPNSFKIPTKYIYCKSDICTDYDSFKINPFKHKQ